MVSLYVCDLPAHVEKEDVHKLFADYQGFLECRLVRDKNRYRSFTPRDKIAFVDFDKEYQAKFATEHLNGYRFPGAHKGICKIAFEVVIRISEHTRAGNKRRGRLRFKVVDPRTERREENRHSERKRSHERSHVEVKDSPKEPPPTEQKDSLLKNIMALGLFKILGDNSHPEPAVNPPLLHNPPISSPVPMSQPPLPTNLLMNPHASFMPGRPMSGVSQFPPERELLPPSEEPRSQSKPAGSFSAYVLNTLSRFYNVFQTLVSIPPNATNTVYVEGIPFEATEREVARIRLSLLLDIFRPYPGFRSVRLIPRDAMNGDKVLFCFADFETALQSTLVINTLQVLVRRVIALGL
eukprot:TRINITY_DN7631_c0_g1_i1.p1 TRINITY_DN7631_c0_g1~~TRINITY_DN7631_c0_g1_i1.p1  ORF type:complete len:352 (+),score=38.33 TRINITY_DN7631_c0_g1_i1:94-1149(+)